MQTFALFLAALIAAIGIAAAIKFFMRCGPWLAFGYGLFGVAVFMIFAATGLWEGANQYDWGYLTPIFALMLVGGWCGIKYGKKFGKWLHHKLYGDEDRN